MPKKQPRNAFYFFMVDFKEEERKKGRNYGNMAEVADAAGPLWRDAAPAVRAKFESIAKSEKQKNNIPEKKFTSTGVPLALIEKQEREQQLAEELEQKDIKDFVKLKAFSNRLKDQDIYLMDVNFYCKARSYIIGESTLLRFNILNGIRDTYHEIINPGKIPMGFTYEVKQGSEEYGLEMPDEHENQSDYIQILANIMDYLKQQDRNAKYLPPIFTMPDKVAPVQDFISQMCDRAEENENVFRVYKLDSLFFHLMNALNEPFPKESLSLAQLKKDLFKYSPGIGCEHHEETDKSMECSMSRVKRWAYTVLDRALEPAAVPPVAGQHLPLDYDLDSIHVYQEQKKGRLAPSIAGAGAWSCNTSVVSEQDTTFNSSAAGSKKEERVHVPLRMPKINYSQVMRQAPELTEDEFPAFPARGKGRGMGSQNRLK